LRVRPSVRRLRARHKRRLRAADPRPESHAMTRRDRAPDWTAEQQAPIADGLTAWELWRALGANGPPWIGAAYRLRDLLARPFGAAPISGHARTPDDAPPPRAGDRVQFFTVDSIADDRLTLKVEDSHLDVLTHVRVVHDGPGRALAQVGSEVWIWNTVGRLYMVPTGPGHRLLVGGMLKRLARARPAPCGAAPARASAR
jgi:hypothetical protein